MRTTGEAPMRAALLAGAAAAVATALVSLPLRSPSDGLLNTGSVVAGVLVVSAGCGLWWRRASVRANARRQFTGGLAVGFLAWTAVALALETELDRVVSFTVPLAAIAFGAIAALTPYLSRLRAARRWIVVVGAIALAVGLGALLADRGDDASGRLELPPRAHVSIVQSL